MISNKMTTSQSTKFQGIPQSKIPTWTHFPIKPQKQNVYQSSAVLMDHYLVVVVHEFSYDEDHRDSGFDSENHRPATLLAVDLRDNSIQEAELPESMFYYHEDYIFTRWGDNKIVKFGGEKNDRRLGTLVVVTITSFEAFSILCQEVQDRHTYPLFWRHTAQVYNDCLYVYGRGGEGYNEDPESKLWCFDLSIFDGFLMILKCNNRQTGLENMSINWRKSRRGNGSQQFYHSRKSLYSWRRNEEKALFK